MEKIKFSADTEPIQGDDSVLKQKKATEEIEKLYKKPTTQEELYENIKILREIPEDEMGPMVIVKLGDPGKDHKFVYMTDQDGREYVIAMPIEKKSMHRDIANLCRRLYKKDLHVVGGGYIHTDGNKLVIDKTSGDYGQAPKERVKQILETKFPNIEIEAYTLKDSEGINEEARLREMLDSLDSDVQRELYTDVLNSKAIKLGFDYTSKPKQIGDNKDFAYTVYSSENGSSFGFDTLYIGFKNKAGEIISKDILREKGYIHIRDVGIDSEKNVLNVDYIIDGKKEALSIPLDELEDFEMKFDLDEVEEKIFKMYKDMQPIFEQATVYHGVSSQ